MKRARNARWSPCRISEKYLKMKICSLKASGISKASTTSLKPFPWLATHSKSLDMKACLWTPGLSASSIWPNKIKWSTPPSSLRASSRSCSIQETNNLRKSIAFCHYFLNPILISSQFLDPASLNCCWHSWFSRMSILSTRRLTWHY